MSGFWIPNLSGVARMTPIMEQTSLTNVGAGALTVVYTVPDGKATVLTHIASARTGGTAPTSLRAEIRDDGSSSLRVNIYNRVTPGIGVRVEWTGHLWLGETDQLLMGSLGGDGTTDLGHDYFGVEFDWIAA
ncbi:MAG: hypothetical protein IIA44_06895 [Acidobacteria bacterium]|nr:hypothetical protein [Acidobacteriota bacterium]